MRKYIYMTFLFMIWKLILLQRATTNLREDSMFAGYAVIFLVWSSGAFLLIHSISTLDHLTLAEAEPRHAWEFNTAAASKTRGTDAKYGVAGYLFSTQMLKPSICRYSCRIVGGDLRRIHAIVSHSRSAAAAAAVRWLSLSANVSYLAHGTRNYCK